MTTMNDIDDYIIHVKNELNFVTERIEFRITQTRYKLYMNKGCMASWFIHYQSLRDHNRNFA